MDAFAQMRANDAELDDGAEGDDFGFGPVEARAINVERAAIASLAEDGEPPVTDDEGGRDDG